MTSDATDVPTEEVEWVRVFNRCAAAKTWSELQSMLYASGILLSDYVTVLETSEFDEDELLEFGTEEQLRAMLTQLVRQDHFVEGAGEHGFWQGTFDEILAAPDRELLRVARFSAVSVTILGVMLVPLFMMFDSIYAAHGAFTAAVTPPLLVTLLLSVFWRRFTRTAALWTLAGGLAAIGLSLFVPEVITPFAHGVPMQDVDDGFLSGMKQYKFMRACYGISVSAVIGVVVSLLTSPEPFARQRGLVWGTIGDALRRFKGSPGIETEKRTASALPLVAAEDATSREGAELPLVRISRTLADSLGAAAGDFIYVTDTRWWLGGVRSTHAVVGQIEDAPGGQSSITLGPAAFASVVTRRRKEMPVSVERLY